MKFLHVMPADNWFAAYARSTAPYYSIVRLAGWGRILRDGQESFVGLRPRGQAVIPADDITEHEVFFGYFCDQDHSLEDIKTYEKKLAEFGKELEHEDDGSSRAG